MQQTNKPCPRHKKRNQLEEKALEGPPSSLGDVGLALFFLLFAFEGLEVTQSPSLTVQCLGPCNVLKAFEASVAGFNAKGSGDRLNGGRQK